MSFYDPLAPVFEATRFEIERTIMGLEQRLLRRKELDLQIEKDLIQQESLQRLRHHDPVLSYPLERGYDAQIQLERRLRDLRAYDTRQQLIHNYAHKQSLELDYLTRLRQIQKQQSAFDHQYKVKASNNPLPQVPYLLPQKHYNNNDRPNPLDESGQMLARKYFDGTRAYEYNQQLKRSGDKQARFTRPNQFSKDKHMNQKLFNQTIKANKNKQPDHSTVKKYQPSPRKDTNQHYQSDHKPFTISKQSPIKQIEQSSKYNSNTGKIINVNQQKQHTSTQKHNKIHQKSQELYSNDNSPHLEPKNIQRSRTKSTQPTNQHIYIPDGTSYSRESRSRSRPKSSSKSKYLSNRQKSSHSLHYHSATKSTLPILSQEIPIDKKFKLWFRERSRLAQQAKQVYEIRYAKNLPEYLWTVFEKEDKFRKELKEKICKIPVVERKYDVGPVNQ